MADVISKLQDETIKIVSSTGFGILDLPDIVCWEDWVDEDMDDEEIKRTARDVAWEIFDNAGMDRDTNNQICYE